jgi:hypothetical protein
MRCIILALSHQDNDPYSGGFFEKRKNECQPGKNVLHFSLNLTTYKAFPGPNSNTFTAYIAKQVPGLDLDLPFSAIDSGYSE